MISTKIKIDLSGFDKITDDIKRGIRQGVKLSGQPLKENARAGHGPGAHSQGRYQNRTGNLTRSIHAAGEVSDMPVTEIGDQTFGGIIALPNYAAPVEAKGYEFMKPAIEDKGVQKEIEEIIADEIRKVL